MQLKLATKVEVKESPGKGLGVFATEVIVPKEIIEECHVITIPKVDIEGNKILNDYRFNWPLNNPIKFVLPLGNGCIYNHSDTNNAYWKEHPKYEAFQFYAIKNIYPGQEICTYYGGANYWNELSKSKKVKVI
tara:strand:- start:918 stop:1316 length:399 start_codon:yes stop_codon:yes gene_type:complete